MCEEWSSCPFCIDGCLLSFIDFLVLKTYWESACCPALCVIVAKLHCAHAEKCKFIETSGSVSPKVSGGRLHEQMNYRSRSIAIHCPCQAFPVPSFR